MNELTFGKYMKQTVKTDKVKMNEEPNPSLFKGDRVKSLFWTKYAKRIQSNLS